MCDHREERNTLTVVIIGRYHPMTSKLLAHEMGHLLGSDHDGTKPVNKDSIYPKDGRILFDCINHEFASFPANIPCPRKKFLMSPRVKSYAKIFSNCTKAMIDAEYRKRAREKRNCLYT